MEKAKIKNTILLCSISLIVGLLIIFGLVDFLSDSLTNSARETVSDIANQQQLAINRHLDGMIYNLTSSAETVAILNNNKAKIESYLQKKQQELDFESAIVIDTEGNAYSSDARNINVENREYFKISIKGETFATKTYKCAYHEKEIVTVSAPIIKNGVIIGVLAMHYGYNHLQGLLDFFTDSSGENFIIDRMGKIIVTTNPTLDYENILDKIDYGDKLSREQVQNSLEINATGSLSYTTVTKLKKFGEYRPIIINDWIIFFEVSSDKTTLGISLVVYTIIASSLVIIIFTIIVIVYIVITKNRYSGKLERIAYYDELTGSPNLAKLKLHMEEYLVKHPSDNYGIVKFDISAFKVINEIYGYETGNKILRAIAKTGASVNENSFLQARTGSDEFIFFAEGKEIYDLHNSKDNFQNHFKALIPELADHNFVIKYGRHYIKKNETDVNDILNKVTIAHSIAKSNNTQDICDYEEKYSLNAFKDVEITNKMHKALNNKEFQMYLQPKINTATGKVMGAEALVRWAEPPDSMIFPNDFIPLFEKNGFILELDKYMLHAICRLLQEWESLNMELLPVSVNFSRLHLYNPHFVSEVIQIVSSYNINKNLIEIEITETAVFENDLSLRTAFRELREAGFKVSIDDFGAGYSSLGMLKDFDIDIIKLDRSFFIDTADIQKSVKAKRVIESIITLSKSLGIATVAEGIETIEQVEFLKSIHCSAIQGYFFSRPLPIEAFNEYCKRTNSL